MMKCFSVTKRGFLCVCVLRFLKLALLGQCHVSQITSYFCLVIPLTVLCLLQVLSKGHLLGPTGVEVRLSRVGTEEKLSVITQAGGK